MIVSGISFSARTSFNPSDFLVLTKEKETVAEVTRRMNNVAMIGCTACRYCCDGCPMSINIPEIFKAVNTLRLNDGEWRARKFYNVVTADGGKAKDCIGCGQCEGVCPQHLPIIELMKQASEQLDK